MGTLGLIHWLILAVLCLGSVAVAAVVAIVIVSSTRSAKRTGGSNLAPCPDCGQMLSPLAKACPHCGRPLQS
jgi:hypothetical protein